MVERIAEREDELIALVSDLIAFDTTARAAPDEAARDERALQDYLADRLASAGAECDVWEPRSEDVAGTRIAPDGLGFDGRPQLAATFRAGGSGRSILLNGHVDVVSPEPRDELDDRPVPGGPARRAALRTRRLRHEGRHRVHGLRRRGAVGARRPARGRPRGLHGDGRGVDGRRRSGRGRARRSSGRGHRARAVRSRRLHRVPRHRHSDDHGRGTNGPCGHPASALERGRPRQRDREGGDRARRDAAAPGRVASATRPATPAPVPRRHRPERDRGRRVGGQLSGVVRRHVPHRLPAGVRRRGGLGQSSRARGDGVGAPRRPGRPVARGEPPDDRVGARGARGGGRCRRASSCRHFSAPRAMRGSRPGSPGSTTGTTARPSRGSVERPASRSDRTGWSTRTRSTSTSRRGAWSAAPRPSPSRRCASAA